MSKDPTPLTTRARPSHRTTSRLSAASRSVGAAGPAGASRPAAAAPSDHSDPTATATAATAATAAPADPVATVVPTATATPPFWRIRRGLELHSAHALPGGRALEIRFRGGQAYRLAPAALGLAGKVHLAAVGTDPRVLVVALADGEMLDLPSTAVLAAAEPAYRAALTVKADTIGGRVRALRLATGRSAVSVAEAAGMARSNFARLETGRHEPRLETLRRVAEALGVPLAALL